MPGAPTPPSSPVGGNGTPKIKKEGLAVLVKVLPAEILTPPTITQRTIKRTTAVLFLPFARLTTPAAVKENSLGNAATTTALAAALRNTR